MKLSNLVADDDAVSPVIGVILMVAITVILAAVIGTFVLDLGQNVNNSGPTASFDFTTSGNDVDITIKSSNQELDGDNIEAKDCASSNPFAAGSTYSAGDTRPCDDASSTLQIVWEDPNSDKTSILATYEK